MASLAASPVAVAVAGKLNVSGLTTGLGYTVGVYDDIPQDADLPLVWIEIPNETNARGFGTGEFGRVSVRVHVFSDYEGTKEIQQITAKVIDLLKDVSLSVSGYTQAGQVFYDESVLLSGVVLHGRTCREMVAAFHVFVEA